PGALAGLRPAGAPRYPHRRLAPAGRGGRQARAASRRGRLGDTRLRVLCRLPAAAPERGDEGALARTDRPAGETRDREMAPERGPAGDPEALELAAVDLLRDRVAREEGDAESLTRGALRGLRRTELPDARRRDPGLAESLLGDLARARFRLAGEQHLLAESGSFDLAVLQREQPG